MLTFIIFAGAVISATSSVSLSDRAVIPIVTHPSVEHSAALESRRLNEPSSTSSDVYEPSYFVVSTYADSNCEDAFSSSGSSISGCTAFDNQNNLYKSYGRLCNSTCGTYIIAYYTTPDCSGESPYSLCANVTWGGTNTPTSVCYQSDSDSLYSKGACVVGAAPWEDGRDGEVTL